MEELKLYRIETDEKEFFIVANEKGNILYRKEKDFVLEYANPNETIEEFTDKDGIQKAVLNVYWCMWPDDYGGEVISDDPLVLEVHAKVNKTKKIPYSNFEEAVAKRKELMTAKKEKMNSASDEYREKLEKLKEGYDKELERTSDFDYLDKVEDKLDEDKEIARKKFIDETVHKNRVPSLEEMLWQE